MGMEMGYGAVAGGSHSRTTASDDFAFCITFTFCDFGDSPGESSLKIIAKPGELGAGKLEESRSQRLTPSPGSHISMLRVGVI